jgi:hypothetical protein
MLNLIAAALVATQTAPAADAHAQHSTMQHGQPAMQHEQHEGMKDCCKDCCKDMKGHEGHMSKGETAPKRGE